MVEHDNILTLTDVAIGYPKTKKEKNVLFSNINLSGRKGELIALIGKNGIGKSTLLRNIAGLQPVLEGDIQLLNKPVHAFKRNEFARLVSFVSTEIINVSNLKVFDLVALGRYPHTNWLGRLGKDDLQQSMEALERVGMKNFMHKNVNEISDGERQRVMIARTLAQDTRIIVLDEPTAFLDLPNKYEIVHLLNHLSKSKHKTILFSTHDLNIAIQEADKIWLMLDDYIIEGAPEDLILNDTLNRIFNQSKLNFDKLKGDFRIKRSHAQRIGVMGSGLPYNWTKKALERLNFTIEKENTSIHHVIVYQEKNSLQWKFINENGTFVFQTIYDLSLFLKSLTK
ncbi:MAG: ABC transporter ATP-binding protein [Bacteroidales bacterium]|jgi:iron complex transport system ATP-binding protein|nr:ABC transporter ATP-binding protein [Bacteroidales bacterium]